MPDLKYITVLLAIENYDEAKSLMKKLDENIVGFTLYNSLESESRYKFALDEVGGEIARKTLDECAIREIKEINNLKGIRNDWLKSRR